MDRDKFAVTYGKMMGFINDDPPEKDDALKCLNVVFVNSKGEPVDVNLHVPAKSTRVIEHVPPPTGVKLVR